MAPRDCAGAGFHAELCQDVLDMFSTVRVLGPRIVAISASRLPCTIHSRTSPSRKLSGRKAESDTDFGGCWRELPRGAGVLGDMGMVLS